MKRKLFTRLITAILAVIICFSGIPTVFAGEVNNSDEVFDINSINLDEYGDVITNEELGYNFISSGMITKKQLTELINTPTTMNARASSVTMHFDYCYDTAGNIIKAVGSSSFRNPGVVQWRFYTSLGDNVYCIEPGVHLASGLSLSSASTEAWDNLTDAQQKAVNTALCYGLEGSKSKLCNSKSEGGLGVTLGQAYIATQLIIWEIVKGQRNPNAPFSLYSGCNGYLNIFCAGGANPNIRAAYNNIVSRMRTYQILPSFTAKSKTFAPTITLDAVYNDLKNEWTYSSKTLNDANGVLSSYKLAGTYDVGNATVTITQSGNTLKLTCSKGKANGTPKSVSLTSKKSGIPTTNRGVLIAYGSPYLQDVVGGGSIDPPNAYMNINVRVKTTGTLTRDARIQKSCWTQSEADDDTTKEGEGSLSTEENLKGWYFKVNASTYFKNYYNIQSFVLGPTDANGFTQSLSEYIIENVDDDLTYDVPLGRYEFVELGKLKEGASGNNLQSDYYFPDGWHPEYKTSENGEKISGVISFHGGAESKIDNVGYATNIFDIPFKLKKINADSSSASNYYFTVTNKETNDVYLLKTTTSGEAYLANDADRKTIIYLPEGNYTIHELGILKNGASGNNYETDYYVPAIFDEPSDIEVDITAEAYKTAQEDGLVAIEKTITNTISAYIQVAKTDVDTGDALAGAVFGVYFDKECTSLLETITTNAEGKARTEYKYAPGTYYIQEITPPANCILDNTVYTVNIESKYYSEYTVSIDVTNEKYPSKIRIHKTDDETGEPLEGVVFGVYKNEACTVMLEKVTTDTQGYADTSMYKPNQTIYLKEIATIPGYILSDEVKSITIVETNDPENLISVSFTNSMAKTPVEIIKSDIDTGDKLEGAVYGLYSDEACTNLLEELTTNENGYAVSKNSYRPSTMYLKEITPPKDYTVNDTVYTVTITVDDVTKGEPVKIEVKDEIQKAKILIYKYDPDPVANSKPVPGATYGLYYNEECTKLAEKLVTGEDGSALTTKEYRLGQTLYLKELVPAPGYKLNETVNTITITNERIEQSKNQIVTGLETPEGNFVWQRVFDIIYKPYLAVYKTDSATGVAVEGATYTLFKNKECTMPVETLTTNADGYAQTRNTFYPGQILYLKEVSSPEGYALDENIYELYVDYVNKDNAVIIKEVQDDPFAPRLTIKKTCTQTGLPVKGAAYCVYSSNETDENGVILSDHLLSITVTDKNGLAEIPVDFVVGDVFYLQEWKNGVPAGYTWSKTITKVEVTQDMNVVIPVTNSIKTGTVYLEKTDSYGNALAGVTFEVYTADGKRVTFGNYGPDTYYYSTNGSKDTVTISSKGRVALIQMPIGDYYLIETSTLDGYMPYGEKIEFSVKLANASDGNAKTLEITVVNNEAVMFNTGGNGDKAIYFIAGAVFIVAIAFFVFARKRKSAKAKK